MDQIVTKRLRGDESFVGMSKSILDYWSWAHSDIASNAERGKLAEFLVATALDADRDCRVEWDAVDVVTRDGIKIEVKSASYLQTWKQRKPSVIQFGIAPKLSWYSENNVYSTAKTREADVYVFCLFASKDYAQANPMDITQWKFYVLSTRVLNNRLPNQKTVRLSVLEKLVPNATDYASLADAVRACIREDQDT